MTKLVPYVSYFNTMFWTYQYPESPISILYFDHDNTLNSLFQYYVVTISVVFIPCFSIIQPHQEYDEKIFKKKPKAYIWYHQTTKEVPKGVLKNSKSHVSIISNHTKSTKVYTNLFQTSYIKIPTSENVQTFPHRHNIRIYTMCV